MDVATLIGLVVGFFLIFFAVSQKGGGLSEFWDMPSFLLVLGGTLAATLINYPMKNVWSVFKVVKNAFTRTSFGYEKLIDQFSSFAEIVRKKGLMSVEQELDKVEDKFMRNGIELAINEKDTKRLRNYLNMELSNIEKRHSIGQEIFFYMGTYSPAFGMVGTVLGLIIMMKHFTTTGTAPEGLINTFEIDISSKFSDLLSGMGMALITTFYGVLFANLIFIPLGGKLKRRSEEEVMVKEFMIEGIICLHQRDHALVVREKLNTFVPESERKQNNKK